MMQMSAQPSPSVRCPKCRSERTRTVCRTASGFRRCDACDHVFRPELVASKQPRQTQHPLDCTKCGSTNLRVIGNLGTPPLLVAKCHTCGHMSSHAA